MYFGVLIATSLYKTNKRIITGMGLLRSGNNVFIENEFTT